MGRLLLIETTKSKSPVIFELEFDDLSKVRVVEGGAGCNLWQLAGRAMGTCV